MSSLKHFTASLTKREFCKAIVTGAVAVTASSLVPAFANTLSQKTNSQKPTPLSEETMPFTLPELPYADNALEPHMSAETFSFHHKKHHNAYVVNLNNLIKDTEMDSLTLEEIITKSAGDASKAGIFNNSAQVWNHTFFWNCMKPNGGGKPTGEIAAKIDADLGGYDAFKEQFKAAATTQFGSGWAWLVLENGKLKITKTGNTDLPMVHNQTALLTVDVWEHAYYIDYQNRRPDFVEAFLTHLVNWDFVNENLKKAA